MDRKGKNSLIYALVLPGVFILFLLSGCVVPKDRAGWSPSWSAGQSSYSFEDEDMTSFASGIRHYEDIDSMYRKACYLQKRRKHRLAIEEFKKIIRIDSLCVKAYNGMGVSCDLLGDFTRAMESYKKAVMLNPGLDYVWNNLGYSCLMQGDIDSAINAFEKAIALNGQDKRYYNNLGLAYARKGCFALAFTKFKVGGNDAQACLNIGRCYYRNGLYKRAHRNFARALALNPSLRNARAGMKAAEALAGISQPSASGIAAAAPPPLSEPAIEISNGNGVKRMAKRTGNYLRKKGFPKTRLTNADNFNHAETMIYYCGGYLHNAYRVAQQIPGYQNMKKVEKFNQPDTKIRVLLGKDMIVFNTVLI
jgi:tetratricopeptide (TPR) repeat protein